MVEVPPMNFLMMDGVGDPNIVPEYQLAIESLYALAYGIKFASKLEGMDYVVPPLEGLWWMEDMNEFNPANKYRWEWTMLIMQPEWVSAEMVDKVRHDVLKKKRNLSISNVRFEPYHEGLCVQILYIGAYKDEASTIAEMHKYIMGNGYQTNGKHHEIYLGDVRKSSPEKLQTILRQPIYKV